MSPVLWSANENCNQIVTIFVDLVKMEQRNLLQLKISNSLNEHL